MRSNGRFARKRLMSIISGAAIAAFLFAVVAPATTATATPGSSPGDVTVFSDPTAATGGAVYTRTITLRHNGSLNGRMLGTFESHNNVDGSLPAFPIYKSDNNGSSWSFVTNIDDVEFGNGNRFQPSLYELPKASGGLPAGTILLAGNSIPNDLSSTRLVLYKSEDGGTTWSFVSTIDTGGPAVYDPSPTSTTTAIWEPSLILDSTGDLVVYYSDERQKAAGILQAVVERVSTDGGTTWGSQSNIVAVADDNTRPGMMSVVQLPNGTYFGAFEVVGQTNVPDYYKTSTDGINWGTTSSLGTEMTTANGTFLFGSPYVYWAPVGGSNGTLIVSGGRVVSSGGGYSKSSFLENTNLGSGNWTQVPAPIDVLYNGDNAAYSQSITATLDNRTLLQFTSIPQASGSNHDVVAGVMPLTPSVYEAENATLTDVSIVDHGPASNYEKVGNINNSDSKVNFTNVSVASAGTYDIRIRYDNGSGATSSQPVSINGGTAITATYAPTRDWGTYDYTVLSAHLNAGTNSISFGHGTGFAELDVMDIYSPSTRYEAESATLTDASAVGGTLRMSSSGGAQVGYINNSDSAVTFGSVSVPAAGNYIIRVGYSNGSGTTSSHSVSVNGGTASILSYPVTADWGTDGQVTFTAALTAGTNSIKFTHNVGFAELDCIDVYQNQ
jgi:hypothetical protein